MLNRQYKATLLASLLLMAFCLSYSLPVLGYEKKNPGSYAPASVYDPAGNRYLMVFTDIDEFMVPGIFGIFVRPDASPDGPPFRISGPQAMVSPDTRPSVSTDVEGNSFLVVWHDWRSGNPDIYAGLLNSGGNSMDGDFVISNGPADEQYPVAAFSPEAGSFIVAWQDSRSGDYDIYARTVTAGGEPAEPEASGLGREIEVYKAPGHQKWISIAYHHYEEGGAYFFLAFEDQSPDKSNPTISGQLIDALKGKSVMPVALGLDISGDMGGHVPSVTSTSSDAIPFMVAWHGPMGEIRARYMDTTGSSREPLDRVFEPEGREGAAGRVRASSDPSTGRSALFWQEYSGDQHDIYASFMEPGDTSGSIYHVMQVAGDEKMDEVNLDVSYNSLMPSFLVAYESTDYLTSFNVLLTSVTDPDYPEISVNDPVYPYEDLSVEYPGVLFNTAVSHTLSVYNDSPYSALKIMNINSTGPFTVAGENCTLESLPPYGEPCSVTVEFWPGTRGLSSGRLSIISDDPNEPETMLHLTGEGLAPVIEITDTSMPPDDMVLDFGKVRLGERSEGTLTIRNRGDHVMSLGVIKMFSADFAIAEDNCSLQALMPNGFCTVVLYASPAFQGHRAAGVWISSDDPEQGYLMVSLLTEGVEPSMETSVDNTGPQVLSFGSVRSGSKAFTHITVRNTGRAPLSIESVEKTGSAFSVNEKECTSKKLGHGDSCSIRVSFSPEDTLASSGEITINSTDPKSPRTRIPLYGFGAIPIASVHAQGTGERSMEFGQLDSGYDSTMRLRITNIGQAPLKPGMASVTGLGFGIVWDECGGASLPYAASCDISVRFLPLSAGASSGRLAIPTNDPEEKLITVPVAGTCK